MNMQKYKKIIGENIRLLRSKKGLTQIDLARETGLSQSTISKAEGGLTGLGAVELYQVANFLEVKVHYFFEPHHSKS